MASLSSAVGEERTVKKLRLSKALTIPEATSVLNAFRRMAAHHVDAVLLNDSNALLSGIVTDKDITSKVIVEELRPEQTIVSKVRTRNPIFVTADTSTIEPLQKMVQDVLGVFFVAVALLQPRFYSISSSQRHSLIF